MPYRTTRTSVLPNEQDRGVKRVAMREKAKELQVKMLKWEDPIIFNVELFYPFYDSHHAESKCQIERYDDGGDARS